MLFNDLFTIIMVNILNCQTSGCSGLDRIRELWSPLEVLAIWEFAQLSLPVMVDLIPHLRDLKLVTLPERITLNDPALVVTINDQLLSRNPPAKINLGILHEDARCQMVEHL